MKKNLLTMLAAILICGLTVTTMSACSSDDDKNDKADATVEKEKINKGDLCYRLFIKHGFIWGGSWRTVKDYQHFEYHPKHRSNRRTHGRRSRCRVRHCVSWETIPLRLWGLLGRRMIKIWGDSARMSRICCIFAAEKFKTTANMPYISPTHTPPPAKP